MGVALQTGIHKEKNATASALLGVAAIQILVGGISYVLYSGEMGAVDKVICFSGLFYIVLGIAARWIRLPSAVIGAVLYGAFLLLQSFHGEGLLTLGLIFKIPIVILLVLAVAFALRNPRVSTGKNDP